MPNASGSSNEPSTAAVTPSMTVTSLVPWFATQNLPLTKPGSRGCSPTLTGVAGEPVVGSSMTAWSAFDSVTRIDLPPTANQNGEAGRSIAATTALVGGSIRLIVVPPWLATQT